MFIRKLPTIKEESDESEYDLWVSNEDVDFVKKIEKADEIEYSCWEIFIHCWCCYLC